MSLYALLQTVWLVGLLAFLGWPKRRCTCGRTKPWYFRAEDHYRARWQYAFTVYVATRCLWMLVHVDYWLVIEALLLTYFVRWLWFHEKGKIKRVARATGRVFVNKHGRLATTSEG